jgi:O-antigen/teichoic acid export membrane protein
MLAFATLPMCFGMAAIVPELLPMRYGSDFSDASLAAAIHPWRRHPSDCFGARGLHDR